MSVARGSADGPKILLPRLVDGYLDLLAELAADIGDDDLWKSGAALHLHAHGWTMEQIGRAIERDKGTVSRQIAKLKSQMLDRYAA